MSDHDPRAPWEQAVDVIRHHADALATKETEIPIELETVERARKHLRTANKDLWRVVNRLDAIVFEEERDTIRRVGDLAETNGESYQYRLRQLVDAGIIEIRADQRRLRKEEET